MAQFVQPLDAAIDISEDEKAYEISAELLGIDANDIDMALSGDMLVLKV